MSISKSTSKIKTLPLIGRKKELAIFEQILNSSCAEFLAVYGRRRVGKTYLIEQYFKSRVEIFFHICGLKNGTTKDQINIFRNELEQNLYQFSLPNLSSWMEAFKILTKAIEQKIASGFKGKIVLFLDELPWLATPKGGLISAIDHFWNRHWSKITTLRLIVCGSAASWMLNNLIHAKGGLHNRLTQRIRLEPFTIEETKLYLQQLKISFSSTSLIETYMCLGGIPYYLRQLQRGKSMAQNIGNLCFSSDGILTSEFKDLFRSLFDESENHIKIIRVLANKPNGLSRHQILSELKIKSGGRISKYLSELEEAGFIANFIPYGKKKKDSYFRIIDEYCLFYLHWIENAPKGIMAKDNGESYWAQIIGTPTYYNWAGLAFEVFCLKHISHIQKSLALEKVFIKYSSWRCGCKVKDLTKSGVQIDILLDRNDNAISLCEIKYSQKPYILDKKTALEWHKKIDTFKEFTKTHKEIFFVLVTFNGVKKNIWTEDLISNEVRFIEMI
ncbi:MAG: ATP-binding protein [Oligoflexia bacterium]|nr:ATP-binding protein [Oligoflexia bacterium]